MSIRVKFPDGSTREFPDGTTSNDVAQSIGTGLAKVAIAARVNGEVWDLARPLPPAADVTIIKEDTPEGWEVIRHSASHIMAGAVKRLFPGTRLGVGPAIEDGFYYDMEPPRTLTEEDLKRIEDEMKKIVQENHTFVRFELPRQEAVTTLGKLGEKYKVEIVEELTDEKVSFYRDGEFTDLCTGPHIPATSRLGAFKLTKVTGAYWRGDEKKPMLQRVYGTAFHNQAALADHLKRLEEAKLRDHRKLGEELDLYSIHPDSIGGGLVCWHPKGSVIRGLIEDQWKKMHTASGYVMVYTPHIASEELYRISGHLENFSDNMYSAMDIEGKPFRVKPMNCPGHIMIYKSKLHSYRELPLRYAELGTVYRFERGGVLHGLMRVRGFTIDDAHIFCRPDQVAQEVISTMELTTEFLKLFGFNEYQIALSTRPEKAAGSVEDWDRAVLALQTVLEKQKLPYYVDEGGGAFYGPKISLEIRDSLKRSWQCSTVQFDFNLPERFDLEYVADDGTRKRPVMVHRALMGSLERFFGVLVEHYGGSFPLWLAPVQAVVLTVSPREQEYAERIMAGLKEAGVRAESRFENDRIGYKIRECTMQKIPYMLVVGEKEVQAGTVALRERKKGDLGAVTLDDFLKRIRQEIETRSLGF